MTNSEVKQVAEDAITTLISNLEQGHSDCLARYLTAMSRFHRYSWNNVLLISLQRATATRVAGFQPWHRFGRFVRKGEKGIVILAPLIGKKKSEDDPESEEKRLFGFRAAYVFDGLSRDLRPVRVRPRIRATQMYFSIADEGKPNSWAESGVPSARLTADLPANSVAASEGCDLSAEVAPARWSIGVTLYRL